MNKIQHTLDSILNYWVRTMRHVHCNSTSEKFTVLIIIIFKINILVFFLLIVIESKRKISGWQFIKLKNKCIIYLLHASTRVSLFCQLYIKQSVHDSFIEIKQFINRNTFLPYIFSLILFLYYSCIETTIIIVMSTIITKR